LTFVCVAVFNFSKDPNKNKSDPKVFLMEKRIGAILILIRDKENVQQLNEILSKHAAIIIGRQGIPIRDKGLSIISLVIEGSTDEFSTLTGQLGRLKGITARPILAKDQA
jgi:putative iron-only hydrogenase system regulator